MTPEKKQIFLLNIDYIKLDKLPQSTIYQQELAESLKEKGILGIYAYCAEIKDGKLLLTDAFKQTMLRHPSRFIFMECCQRLGNLEIPLEALASKQEGFDLVEVTKKAWMDINETDAAYTLKREADEYPKGKHPQEISMQTTLSIALKAN